MTYWTRSTPVEAIQFNGTNTCVLEEAIRDTIGHEVHLNSMMDVGTWLVIRKSDRSWQTLPDGVFQNIYQQDRVAPATLSVQVVPIPVAKTCFTCTHHLDTHCMLFDEQIDSEIYAAADCSGYDYDGAKDD